MHASTTKQSQDDVDFIYNSHIEFSLHHLKTIKMYHIISVTNKLKHPYPFHVKFSHVYLHL